MKILTSDDYYCILHLVKSDPGVPKSERVVYEDVYELSKSVRRQYLGMDDPAIDFVVEANLSSLEVA